MTTDDAVPIDPDLAPRPRRLEPDVLAVIALGGIVGATARFGVAEALPTAPGHFPWATFWTNLSGSLLLGFLLILIIERVRPTRYLRPFLATGVIGAYTTMSTYAVETAVLIKDGHAAVGLTYGIGSLAAGVFLAYAGMVGARFVTARSADEAA